MISDNNAINKQEILTRFKDQIMQLAGSYRKNVLFMLNREEFDVTERNDDTVSTAPMSMRDDINLSHEKIMERLNIILDKPDIQYNDLVELCREVYLYLIRFGFILYHRYYDDNGRQRMRVNKSTAVFFKHDFIYSNSEEYRRYYDDMNNLDISSIINGPVTDTSIFELLNKTVQHALSRGDVSHTIRIDDCHSNCHSNCHSDSYRDSCNDRDDDDDSGGGICDYHGDCNCWLGGGNTDQCYTPGY